MAPLEASTILEKLPDGMIVTDDDGYVLSLNAEARRVLGYDHNNKGKLTLQDLCVEDWESFSRQMESLKNGLTTLWPMRLRSKSGAMFWAELNVRRMDGQIVILFRAVQTDPWVNPLPDDSLTGQERDLHLLADLFPEPVWLCDNNANVIYCNQAWFTYTGQTLAEARGRGWKRSLHPDDYHHVAKLSGRTVRTGDFYDVVYRLRRADGVYRWNHARAAAFRDRDGTFVRFFGTCVDIHDQVMMRETLEEAVAKRTAELRDREERLTLLFEHAPDAYFLLSSKMTVVAVNRAAEQLTGHPRDKLIGSNAHQLGLILPSCDKALRTRSLKELHSTPSAVHEIVIVREGGQVCEVAMRTVRLVIDGKRHFLMQGRDVSDRRRLERKLLKIADLERQRIGQELHDGLCQQLVGTAFAVKTLERSLLKHSKRDAGKVSEIGQLLSQLIQQARTISTGLAPVNASQEGFVIALNELAIQMNKVGSIRCRFLGGRVLINDNHIATHLYRIAQQAVTNAFQHAQPTDVVIELLDQPDVIVMIVRDDGVGIPSDACRRGGFGLTNMQYRARMIQATLEIAPGNPNGTIVSCTVPKIVLQSKYSRTAA